MKTRDRDFEEPNAVLADKIGIRQSLTPEGFLLCEEVPVARTGWMVYGPGETPIEVDDRLGYAEVYRDPEDLFSDDTMRSMTGKPIVDEHPVEDVAPSNWKNLAKGFAMNIRPGSGFDDDCLMADLMITDQQAIAAVRSGKREVSAGYTADYQQTGPGQGLQSNIIFNHIALVERGRCGPRCAIGDHQPLKKGTDMGTKTTGGLAPKRRAVLTNQVRDALAELERMEGKDEEMNDDASSGSGPDESHTHIHIHQPPNGNGNAETAKGTDEPPVAAAPAAAAADPNEARFAQIEQSLADLTGMVKTLADTMSSGGDEGETEASDAAAAAAANGDEEDDDKDKDKAKASDEFPPKKDDDDKDDDDKKKSKSDDKSATKDSAALATSYQDTLALAEILVPGFRMPTFDAKAKRSVTIDAMCDNRRLALTACYATVDGKMLIDTVVGTPPDLAKMDCKAIAVLFKGAAGARKLMNNRGTGDGKLPEQKKTAVRPQTNADMNKFYRDFYASKDLAAKH